MRELRFDQTLYAGEAVDRGVKVLGELARFELSDDDGDWIVRLQSHDPVIERRVAGELMNFALGLTLEGRKGR